MKKSANHAKMCLYIRKLRRNGNYVVMSDVPSNPDTGIPPDDLSSTVKLKDLWRKLGIQWLSWVLELSRDIQPLIKETIIFGIFILGEQLIVGWTGPAFAEVTKHYSIVDGLYDIIKIASLLLIIIHYLGNCIVDINKEKETFSKVFPQRFNLFSIVRNELFNRQKPNLANQSIPAIQPAPESEEKSKK